MPLLANTGVPMLLVAGVPLVLAFVPIVVIEALVWRWGVKERWFKSLTGCARVEAVRSHKQRSLKAKCHKLRKDGSAVELKTRIERVSTTASARAATPTTGRTRAGEIGRSDAANSTT